MSSARSSESRMCQAVATTLGMQACNRARQAAEPSRWASNSSRASRFLVLLMIAVPSDVRRYDRRGGESFGVLMPCLRRPSLTDIRWALTPVTNPGRFRQNNDAEPAERPDFGLQEMVVSSNASTPIFRRHAGEKGNLPSSAAKNGASGQWPWSAVEQLRPCGSAVQAPHRVFCCARPDRAVRPFNLQSAIWFGTCSAVSKISGNASSLRPCPGRR